MVLIRTLSTKEMLVFDLEKPRHIVLETVGEGQSIRITPCHGNEFSHWPHGLFPKGRMILDLQNETIRKDYRNINTIVNFLLSERAPRTIVSFVCKKATESEPQRFIKTRVKPPRLLLLPNEIQTLIYRYALTTDHLLSREIHLHEEERIFRFAETARRPFGEKRSASTVHRPPYQSRSTPSNSLAKHCLQRPVRLSSDITTFKSAAGLLIRSSALRRSCLSWNLTLTTFAKSHCQAPGRRPTVRMRTSYMDL